MREAIKGTTRKANTWCGPYALALVSGLDYDTVYQKLLRQRNKSKASYQHKAKYIAGVYHRELWAMARKLCSKTFDWDRSLKGKTLGSMRDHLKGSRVYIIAVTGHYVVLDSRTWEVCDNQTKVWIPLAEWQHKKVRVQAIGEVRNHKL